MGVAPTAASPASPAPRKSPPRRNWHSHLLAFSSELVPASLHSCHHQASVLGFGVFRPRGASVVASRARTWGTDSMRGILKLSSRERSHFVEDSDAAVSNSETKELDGESMSTSASAGESPDNQRVVMAVAMRSDLPPLNVSGADSPRSRIGRGLESIGGMTADTIQRISAAVGGVVKSPVVLIAKVGGLASPRFATISASPGISLEDRVFQLEMQMKRFEEKVNPRTALSEVDPSSQSFKEKPRIAKSLLPEMETEGALAKRVQLLEDRVNERMERIEKQLSSILSQLDLVDLSRRESVDGYERQESLSGEPHYYDAEQQSDNFDTLEGLEQKYFEERSVGTHDLPGQAFGASHASELSPVKEPVESNLSSGEPVERALELHAGKSGDIPLVTQLASTSMESVKALVEEPVEAAAPGGEPTKLIRRDDAANVLASSDRQLVSTLENLHKSFVTEPSAAAASEKCFGLAKADSAAKLSIAHASSEPQSASAIEEPREAFPEVPSVAKFEAPAEMGGFFIDGLAIAAAESSLPATPAALQDYVANGIVAAAPNAKPAQELADSDIAIASSEPSVASKFVEESSRDVSSEEPALKEAGDKSGPTIAAAKSPVLSSLEETQGEFGEELMAIKPSVEPAPGLAAQVEKDVAFAAHESQAFVEKQSAAATSTHFEEPLQEDAAEKTVAARESSAPEEPKEARVIESMVSAPSAELAQERSDMAVASSEPEGGSTFVEGTSASTASASFEEPEHETDTDKSGAASAFGELETSSSLNDLQEERVVESFAVAPSAEPAQELAPHLDISRALLAPESTTSAGGSPLPSSSEGPEEDFAKETLAAGAIEKVLEPTDSEKNPIACAPSAAPSASFYGLPQGALSKESSGTNAALEEPAQESGKSPIAFAPSATPSASFYGLPEGAISKEPSGTSVGLEEPAQESGKSPVAFPPSATPSASFYGLPEATISKEPSETSAAVEELAQESGKSPIAFAPSTSPSAFFYGLPEGVLSKEPSETSVALDEPAQEMNGLVLPNSDSTSATTLEKGNPAANEAECKLAEDVKVPDHEHFESSDGEFTKSHISSVHGGVHELKPGSLAAEDSDYRPESDQSGEEFFDAEHGSGSSEPWEPVETKSLEEFVVGPDEPVEAMGITAAAQTETLVPAPSAEPAQELEQTPVREFAQGPEHTPAREFERGPEMADQLPSGEREQEPMLERDQQPAQEQGRLPALESAQERGQPYAQERGQDVQHHLEGTGQETGPAPSQELEQLPTQDRVQEHRNSRPELQSEQDLAQEPEREDLAQNSALALAPSEPQFEESKESAYAVPSSESTGPVGGFDGGALTSSEPQLTPSLEEPLEGFVKQPVPAVAAAEMASKSANLEESFAAVAPSVKLAREGVSASDKSTTGLVEESPPTSSADEAQNGSVGSLMEGKLGQNEADQKTSGVVKINAEPIIEGSMSRTGIDSVSDTKLQPHLQDQGSFLSFGATSVESATKDTPVVKEPNLPTATLVELFQKESFGKKGGPIPADSPMTSVVSEEPPKPLVAAAAEAPSSAKPGHLNRRSIVRSASEPELAYNLEEHRKGLVKGSSVTAIPSASKFEQHAAHEDFADTQCLPFRILGDGKHSRKESESKLEEDVKSPAPKSGAGSSYVLDPRPSKIKERKKKEKKEKKLPDPAAAEERTRRHSIAGMERKSSLRADEKDGKFSTRAADEKHKQPFRHLRDRLRHAFSVNKEP